MGSPQGVVAASKPGISWPLLTVGWHPSAQNTDHETRDSLIYKQQNSRFRFYAPYWTLEKIHHLRRWLYGIALWLGIEEIIDGWGSLTRNCCDHLYK